MRLYNQLSVLYIKYTKIYFQLIIQRMTRGVPAHLDLAIPGPYVHISYINCKKHSIVCLIHPYLS